MLASQTYFLPFKVTEIADPIKQEVPLHARRIPESLIRQGDTKTWPITLIAGRSTPSCQLEAHPQSQTWAIPHSVLGLKVPAGSPVRKKSVSGKQKLAIAKSSPCSLLAKVIQTLPLTIDSFDGSGFKKFRWAAFGSLLALRSSSKSTYQPLTSSCSY